MLHGQPEPLEGQCLAVVRRSSGANLFEVHTEGGDRGVALLPTRFRKLVWLKRGDAIILSAPSSGVLTTNAGGVGAVTHIVENILYEPGLKHLRAIGRLPAALEAVRAEIVSGIGGTSGGGEDLQNGEEGGEETVEEKEDEGEGGNEGEEEEAPSAGGRGGRKLQGPRGMPPSDDEEGEEEEEEGEEKEGGGGGGEH